MNQALLASRVRNRKLYICAVDASKAFDKVSREKLWDLMVVKKINPAIVMAIKNYYSHSFMVLQIDSSFSEAFTTSVGLRQDGACSPKLFSIYTENLITEAEKVNEGIKLKNIQIDVISYADDVLLKTN